MSLAPDVYTPWREDPAGVAARHIGREAELSALVGSIAAFAKGGAPLPIYVYGPRGVGKSHLLVVARQETSEALSAQGIAVRFIPEDIPAANSAAALTERFLQPDAPAWMRVIDVAPATETRARRVLVLEGLHRHLAAMSAPEQRALRGWFVERPWIYLVCTGVTMPKAFGRDGAFFGFFDPFPLLPLEEDGARALLERMAPAPLRVSPRWKHRSRALVALSGGSPRALIALGSSLVESPDAVASEHLHAVVRAFTAHYQMRFQDLTAQEQQVVEQLTLVPRELSPTEIGRAIQRSSSHASQIARRMEGAGVVLSRRDGRSTWYSLAEPLFRHWYEYRTAPWEQTRAEFVGRLLEAVYEPEELVAAWWENPDPEVRRAALKAIERQDETQWMAWKRLVRELWPRAAPDDLQRRRVLVQRALELPPSMYASVELIRQIQKNQWELASTARPFLAQTALAPIEIAWDFRESLTTRNEPPRGALKTLISRLSSREVSASDYPPAWEVATEAVLSALPDNDSPGRPWKLTNTERRRLARLPWFRVAFLLRGRRSQDKPLLRPSDVLSAGLREPLVDEGALLIAAAEWRDQALFGAVVVALMRDPWFFNVPSAPDPYRPCPGGADELAISWTNALSSLKSHAYRRRAQVDVLSWAASFAEISEERWEGLLDVVVAPLPEPQLTEQTLAPVEAALIALGVLRIERLEELITRLAHTSPLHTAALRALSIARQLLNTGRARLHPELELLRSKILPEG